MLTMDIWMNQTFVFLVEVWRVLLCFLCSVYLPMMCLLILLLLEPGFLILSTFLSFFLQNFVFYLLLLLLTHPPTPSKWYLPMATLPLPCDTIPTPNLSPVSTVVYIGIWYTYTFTPCFACATVLDTAALQLAWEKICLQNFFKDFLRREANQKNVFVAIKLFFPWSPVFYFFCCKKIQIYPKIHTKSVDLSSVWGAGAQILSGPTV